mmetsp:Transcript_114138/g.333657  ORF Transcript_114138/g.333657 Transcript_114138/m.333657 type:complete len:202 (-) Transcript_114138:1873-2478(-)
MITRCSGGVVKDDEAATRSTELVPNVDCSPGATTAEHVAWPRQSQDTLVVRDPLRAPCGTALGAPHPQIVEAHPWHGLIVARPAGPKGGAQHLQLDAAGSLRRHREADARSHDARQRGAGQPEVLLLHLVALGHALRPRMDPRAEALQVACLHACPQVRQVVPLHSTCYRLKLGCLDPAGSSKLLRKVMVVREVEEAVMSC